MDDNRALLGRDDRRLTEAQAEPARPAPLLWPTAALAGGIWLSEAMGLVEGIPLWLIFLLPVVSSAGLMIALRTRGALVERVCVGLVLVTSLTVGFVRHQSVLIRPPQHVVHALENEPILTRVVGDVVVTPLSGPGERWNPFLPFEPEARSRFVVQLREFRTGGSPTPVCGRVRVSVTGELHGIQLGDRIELTGKLYSPRGPQNPGETDWARWNRLQGIDAGLSVEGPQHVRRLDGGTSWTLRSVASIRGVAENLLLEPYADVGPDPPSNTEAGRLLDTMVLGQRTAASREINEAFLRAGATHFLAVSGFNVSLLAGATWWLLRRVLRAGASAAALATLAVIVLFAVVAEPNAPILRASIGGLLATVAVLTRRPLSILNWLAFSAMAILLFNPLELFRPGFQLSFVQVLALLTVVPWVYRKLMWRRGDEPLREANTLRSLLLQRCEQAVVGLAVVSVVAWLVGLPLVWWHFRYLTIWGAVGSFVLSLPVALLTILSFATMLANLVLPPVGHWLAVALWWMTDGLLRGVELFRHLPGALLEITPPPLGLVVVSYAVLLLIVSGGRRPHAEEPVEPVSRRGAWLRVAAGLAVVLGWGTWFLLPVGGAPSDYVLHALAVGNGSALVVTAPGDGAAVLDVGTDRNADAGTTVVRALRTLRVRSLESVVISHANFDHYSGLPTLLRQVPTRQLALPAHFEIAEGDSRAVRQLFALLNDGDPGTGPKPPAAGRPYFHAVSIVTGNELHVGEMLVEVLWPPADLGGEAWGANDCSAVLRLHAGGRTELVPGDVERAAIRGLLAAEGENRLRLASDVLIAPHHGSVKRPETAAFLAAVDPEVIVVSAVARRPAFESLVCEVLGPDRCVVTTGELGAITVCISPAGDIKVETPLAPRRR